MLLAGCSINGDATGASSDSATSESSSENGSAGGQKLAASLSEWIEQRESQGNIAESQKTILDKAKSTGVRFQRRIMRKPGPITGNA